MAIIIPFFTQNSRINYMFFAGNVHKGTFLRRHAVLSWSATTMKTKPSYFISLVVSGVKAGLISLLNIQLWRLWGVSQRGTLQPFFVEGRVLFNGGSLSFARGVKP